jgi:hypothetical protein
LKDDLRKKETEKEKLIYQLKNDRSTIINESEKIVKESD